MADDDEPMTADAWQAVVGARASFTMIEGQMTIAGIEWATYAPSRRLAHEIVRTLVDVASRLANEREKSGTPSATWLRFNAKNPSGGVEEGGIAIM